MRVFVAGATGAVGRRLVPMLVNAGHSVVGMTRSADKIPQIRELGAEGVAVDAFNRGAVIDAIGKAAPEAVIHQLTAIPQVLNPANIARDFELTNRLRREGTDHLLEGARRAGARRFIAQSFGGYMWAASPGPALSEEQGRDADPPSGLAEIAAAIEYVERVVPAAVGVEGIVLRYGGFYGPGTGLAEGGATVNQVRNRQFPVIGGGKGSWSFVHIDDAASATVRALDHGRAGVYNVADDEPAAVAEWLPYLAKAVGAPAPRHFPAWLGRLAAGESTVTMMTKVRGIANAKAKRELAWTPRWPSWREGFLHGLA